MNVVGVGIDLVEIAPFAEKLSQQSFRDTVFTSAEREQADARKVPAETYAGKFAAKEAVMKALQAGIRQSVWFTAVEILSEDTGAPIVTLHRAALARAQAVGITGWQVSISHTSSTAVAVVLALTA